MGKIEGGNRAPKSGVKPRVLNSHTVATYIPEVAFCNFRSGFGTDNQLLYVVNNLGIGTSS